MSTPIGKIVKVDNSVEDFTIGGPLPLLKEMQNVVGGYIERIKLPHFATFENLSLEPLVMIINEEAHVKHYPINVKACMLAQQNIAGNVIIMPARFFR